jgi:hypothetical protein
LTTAGAKADKELATYSRIPNIPQARYRVQDTTYVFVDGGYLKTAYKETVHKLFGSRFEIEFA